MPSNSARNDAPHMEDAKLSNEDVNAADKQQNEPKKDDDTPMIVHQQYVTDPNTGAPKLIEHGPMPVKDWAAYEKEHNL